MIGISFLMIGPGMGRGLAIYFDMPADQAIATSNYIVMAIGGLLVLHDLTKRVWFSPYLLGILAILFMDISYKYRFDDGWQRFASVIANSIFDGDYNKQKQIIMTHELPPPVQLMQMLFGFAASCAIGVSAELRIADLLKDGAKSVEELAQQSGVHARSLYRVLRACASIGVYSEDDEKKFSLTPLAEPLLSDAPGSLRAFAEMITCDWQFQTWAELPYSVQTGKPSFEKVFGMSSFDYFWSNEKAEKYLMMP